MLAEAINQLSLLMLNNHENQALVTALGAQLKLVQEIDAAPPKGDITTQVVNTAKTMGTISNAVANTLKQIKQPDVIDLTADDNDEEDTEQQIYSQHTTTTTTTTTTIRITPPPQRPSSIIEKQLKFIPWTSTPPNKRL